MGYSPWVHKESGMTEPLNPHNRCPVAELVLCVLWPLVLNA